MALAKYEMTKQGKGIKASNKSTNFDIPSTSSAGRMEASMNRIVKEKSSSQMNNYLLTARNSYLKGQLSDVEYYTVRANVYEKAMNSATGDDAMKYENYMMTALDSAKNASEDSASKARSAATKAANLSKGEREDQIKDLERGIVVKLNNGGYKSNTEYLTDLSTARDMRADFYKTIKDSSVFSDSQVEAAKDKYDRLVGDDNNGESNIARGEYSESGAGYTIKYGGLDYKLKDPDRFVMVQNTSGAPDAAGYGDVELKELPGLSKTEYNGKMVKGSDDIYREVQQIGKANNETGMFDYTDPATGETRSVALGSEEHIKYDGLRVVKVIDPNSKEEKSFVEDRSALASGTIQWKGVGDKEGITYKKPGWENAPIDMGKLASEQGNAGGQFMNVNNFTGKDIATAAIPGTPGWQAQTDEYNTIIEDAKKNSGNSTKILEEKANEAPLSFMDAKFKKDIAPTDNGSQPKQDDYDMRPSGGIDIWSKAQSSSTGGFSGFKKWASSFFN